MHFICFYNSRSHLFTLHEVLSQIEEEEDTIASADVFISPPSDGNNSEEDDVNDDVQETITPSELCGRQLNSQAHATISRTDGSRSTIGNVSLYLYLFTIE